MQPELVLARPPLHVTGPLVRPSADSVRCTSARPGEYNTTARFCRVVLCVANFACPLLLCVHGERNTLRRRVSTASFRHVSD